MKVNSELAKFIKWCENRTPYKFKITCGVRTAKEQKELYEFGRTKKGKKVTNCDGYVYKSMHQLGRAIDFAVYDEKNQITWKIEYYIAMVKSFKKLADEYKIDLRFGADFKMKDYPHIEI